MTSSESPVINLAGDLVAIGPLRRDLLHTPHLRWGNDFATMRFLGEWGVGSLDHNERWYEHRTRSPDVQEFLIYECSTWRPLGTTNLHGIDEFNRGAELAIGIMEPDARGKGYGTEAALLTLVWAFDMLKLHRVQARVFAYNPASLGLCAKLGFHEFGRARDVKWMGGHYWDIICFDMLADEFSRLHGDFWRRVLGG